MKIHENFIEIILKKELSDRFQEIYDNSMLLQYLDRKMKAIHGNSKTRRSLGNIYAIYSILHFYQNDFFGNPAVYKEFEGYDYTKLFIFYRGLYGGSKLQNHSLNSRVNSEFKNKIPNATNDLIIVNDGKYLMHINYLYVDGIDISKICCKIIEKYIDLLLTKDHTLLRILSDLEKLPDTNSKIKKINELLTDDVEARIFEIISFAILKNHFSDIVVYFGYSEDRIEKMHLKLFKTGRTNANDGGIDFVMRPVGRFFQVTEINNYDKYLLDIEKVMHFPITFVIKTEKTRENVWEEIRKYIVEKSSGMRILENRYNQAIEDIITINELKNWTLDLTSDSVNNIIRDIDVYYKMEMNLEIDAVE